MGIFANAFKSNGENNGGAGFFFILFYSIVLQVANVCYFQAMDVSAYLEMKR